MKSHQLLSEKDLQVLKVTYRTLIDNYYENPSQQNVVQIILLNSITMQTISTRQQSDSLLLISMLEILKLKTKSTSKQLFESVQSTIIHLKNPLKIYIKNQTIQNGLQRVQLYTLCCLVISRFYEHEMKPKVDSYDWNSFIQKISKNCDKNMAIAVEVLVLLVADFMMFGKQVNNSGMVKYICSVYLPQTLTDKINLYRALKLLKLVSINDKSVLPSRQKNIGLVIYTHPAYTIIIQQISQLCFQQEYSKKVLGNTKDIDAIFVWSYYSKFCQLTHQKTIDDLQKMLVESGKDISVDLEYKIYMTISNLIRVNNLKLNQSWRIPYRHQNLNVYLRMVNSMIEKNAAEYYKKIDLKGIQAAYDKRKITDPVTDKLIKDMKSLDPNSTKKVGKLDFSYLQQYSIDKNTDILMQKAGKIPRNNEQLQITQQILNINKKNADEFELDIISSLKSKAIESLRKSILNYSVDLPIIFNNLKPENYDVDVINKLIKLGQLYVVKNPESGTKFNAKKFIDIMDWLENNHGIAIIDWVAAGEILTTIFGPDQWQKHMGEIPNRNFWLLNSYNAGSNSQIISQIGNVALTHPKLPLILGFISKSSNQSLKSSLLKTKMLQQIITKILSYKNSRATTKSIREQDLTDGHEMNRYLINVLNMSSYIFEWSKGQDSKEIESRIVRPCLQNVIRCFHGEQHELKFIENCLPHAVGVLGLKDLNMGRLLETHGKLSSYLDKNGYENKIDLNKINNIALQSNPQILEQILVFLQENPNLIEKKVLISLLEKLLNSQKNGNKYWKYFPHYMSIINHIIKIVTKSKNAEVINNLTDIYQMIIGGTADNPNITEFGEHNQFYENILEGLDGILDRKIRIDAKRLIREAQKIKDPQWKTKIISKLKEIDANIAKWPTKPQIKQQTPQNLTKVSSVPQSSNLHSLSTSVLDNYPQDSPNGEIQQKKDQFLLKEGDTNEYLKTQQGDLPSMSPQEKSLLDALKMLKKIIRKQQPKQTFPKLVDIFMSSDLNRNQRYILGQLLTEYYQIIQKNPKIIEMLQLKDKTNLNREVCFNFLTKFQEVFVISKRWKLSGYDFLDLAMQRVQCTNKNKVDCVQNGCQIAEYNLTETKDTTYFYNKKYHEIVKNILSKISQPQQLMYYLILVGSSAKLVQIKTNYTDNQLHTKLIESLKKQEYFKDHRIMANFSYALSSLIYTQSHISTDVVSRKEGMLKIFNGMRTFVDSKSVVEAGCSLLSNLCFSNKESKQMLHSYGISELLLFIFNKCLQHPQVSTYKQILRTMGNISLHKGCAESLIDGHICSLVIKLIVGLKIILYKDDEKTKLLKLCIDVISNLTGQKYKLLEMHNEKITNMVIELLNDKGNVDDNILMSAIDTIDGLCQIQDVESYVVMDKKLLLRLIDLLKVKQDQKLITKIIRLLTNMTLNERCTPQILQGGLLGVLANVVLPVIRNEKIDMYVKKIVIRIFNHKADIKLILKGGYLDCLLQAIESGHQVDEQYVNILLQYSMYIPNYLNNRTFFCLLRMMVSMQKNKQVLDKCLKVIKTIVGSEQKSVDDVQIQGCAQMYDKLYQNQQIGKVNVLYLMALHCTKSKLMKKQMLALNKEHKSALLDNLSKLNPEDQSLKSLVLSTMFSIHNKNKKLIEFGEQLVKQQDLSYKILSKGFPCKLYRVDGSSKNAIIDINQMYYLRAYKAPDGEVKDKYLVGVKQLRDWQFNYQLTDDAWKSGVFVKDKTVFGDKAKIGNCVTLLGSKQWGGFIFINIQFIDSQAKVKFVRAISALISAFKT